jgi:phosphoribosylformylglycinamidine (FGAM) synthase-like amidotransferase family enzyme
MVTPPRPIVVVVGGVTYGDECSQGNIAKNIVYKEIF